MVDDCAMMVLCPHRRTAALRKINRAGTWARQPHSAGVPGKPGCRRSAGRRRGPSPAAAGRRDRRSAAACASSTAGAMASEVATMQPTMMAKPSRRGLRGHRQRFGQAAGLVELDVDGVVFAGERRQRGAVMHAFVGADRHRPLDAGQRLIARRPAAAARPAPRRRRRRRRDWRRDCPSRQPSLASTISVAFGRGRAHRGDARGIAACSSSPPSLILSSARRGGLGGGRGHGRGRAERDREGGGERARGGQARRVHAPGGRCAWPPGPRSAQSSALRAAPGGIASCRAAAVEPGGRAAPASPRCAARDASTLSP